MKICGPEVDLFSMCFLGHFLIILTYNHQLNHGFSQIPKAMTHVLSSNGSIAAARGDESSKLNIFL